MRGLIAAVWPTEGFFILIIPLFLAGLVMMPLLIPFFDRKAKQDLAEYRAAKEAAEQAEPAGPPGRHRPRPGHRRDSVKAAYRDRYGPPDVVDVREMERPTPLEDQVLVRVHAASVNRADLDLLRPKPSFTRAFLGLRAPRTRRVGLDVAGVVESTGPDATRFHPGDRVSADLYPFGYGAFAAYACASERAFQRIPDAMSFEHAATLPHSAILAIQGLRSRRGRSVEPGDKVLIVGASGNVGPFAVQIAKALGAEVTGVCSTSKVDFVRSLGADHVIDYATTDYTTTGERYDWILDVDSHNSILRCRRALRPKGVYVTLGGSGRRLLQAMVLGPLISIASSKQMGLLLWWKPFLASDVAALGELIAAGRLVPVIDRRFPLADLVEALHYVDDGHATGKVIITMDQVPAGGVPA